MIDWLAILTAVLKLANFIASYCHDKQLLDAGNYEAIAQSNSEALKKIQLAIIARDNPVDVVSDPNNRDGR